MGHVYSTRCGIAINGAMLEEAEALDGEEHLQYRIQKVRKYRTSKILYFTRCGIAIIGAMLPLEEEAGALGGGRASGLHLLFHCGASGGTFELWQSFFFGAESRYCRCWPELLVKHIF